MNKEELVKGLVVSHRNLIDYVNTLTAAKFMHKPPQKWTGGQQLDHILLSLKQFNLGLKMPKLILRMTFGLSNRPSRTYEEVIERYQIRLKEGGKAPKKFVPKEVLFSEREELANMIEKNLEQLEEKMNKFSEPELDQYLLPHPLLGKMTLREMLYFMCYHTDFHRDSIKTNLEVA